MTLAIAVPILRSTTTRNFGSGPGRGGKSTNGRLGAGLIVGKRVWDVQSKFRIRLGPLRYSQFCDFLPPGTAFRPLADLSRLYAGQPFDIDAQLVLLAADVPWCQLNDSQESGARLGWNTWIRCGDFARDVDDPVFAIVDQSSR